MQSSSEVSSVNTSTVEVIRLGLTRPSSFELRDISYRLSDVSRSTLNEFFFYAYNQFKKELETILRERHIFTVSVYFSGVFTEYREVWYNDDIEWYKVEHFIDHKTGEEWIINFTDIEKYYNSFIKEYREIAHKRPAEWDYYSITISIRISDINFSSFN